MRRCWRLGGFFPLALVVASIWFPKVCCADVKATPEVSVYLTHNQYFRSRLDTSATYSNDKSDFTSASFEYDLDVTLVSYFRRYVFKDPNAEKSKRVTVRLGYAYLPDLVTGDPDRDEKRALGEITFRFPLGRAWLLSDRNRGELRRIGDVETGRYRNRLRLESNVVIGDFRMTPYANAEAYYESKTDEWNQADGTLGAEFPWAYQTILEFYFTWQFAKNLGDNQVLGLTLQKHL